jgi:hypothetical protein
MLQSAEGRFRERVTPMHRCSELLEWARFHGFNKQRKKLQCLVPVFNF